MRGKAWKLDHNPDARPLGCNGRYGNSGSNGHRQRGEKPCRRCRVSEAHYYRERRRGAKPIGREVAPCGTPGAARRHRKNGEPRDWACKVAEAKDRAERYQRRKAREREAAVAAAKAALVEAS